MKRETRIRLSTDAETGSACLTQADARDILDSDARQAAELRALRKAVRTLRDNTCDCDTDTQCPSCEVAEAALKPARRKP